MHKGKKHNSVMEGYNDFARSEGVEAAKYVDSVRTNNPFGKGVDDMMDEESRRRERGYYVEGTVIKSPRTISKKEGKLDHCGSDMMHSGGWNNGRTNIGSFKLPHQSPLDFKGANSENSSCWDGYKKEGTKPSPSGTGETVNNCVKI
jgi:hypothetical protein